MSFVYQGKDLNALFSQGKKDVYEDLMHEMRFGTRRRGLDQENSSVPIAVVEESLRATARSPDKNDPMLALASPAALLSLLEKAKKTKAMADQKAFADEYSTFIGLAQIQSQVPPDVFAKFRAQLKPGAAAAPAPQGKTMEPKPINQANVDRRVAEYDCRGHWWSMTPGFFSLALVGAVAGLVRRTIK